MTKKRDVLTKVVSLVDVFTDEEREVAQKMIDQLDKKSSKPTKTQLENVKIKNDILAILADGRARTAREVADIDGYTTAKVSALLRQMVLDGKVVKITGEKSKDAPKYFGDENSTPYEE